MQHLRAPDVPPGEVLSVLMKEPGNRQVDLHHIATQSDISEMINGKRAMKVSQIRGLAKFCHVSLEMFIGQ
ncbi:putative transcription regulator containing HTH domain [Erwinia amylovora Ea644]|uniref:transcriptional regulator n=1 Tax=Erwinia amylovora TaxID=552 RepID=UPI0002CB4476|nr:transcriptional regulator [Erwinia amylovora]CCP03584.1 putative transcription regulator containing HTH domain [Erwinia amylovora Ea644]CCP07620.1 putative transcription regulator containing HTH domain [Erwinia amylovora MR1]